MPPGSAPMPPDEGLRAPPAPRPPFCGAPPRTEPLPVPAVPAVGSCPPVCTPPDVDPPEGFERPPGFAPAPPGPPPDPLWSDVEEPPHATTAMMMGDIQQASVRWISIELEIECSVTGEYPTSVHPTIESEGDPYSPTSPSGSYGDAPSLVTAWGRGPCSLRCARAGRCLARCGLPPAAGGDPQRSWRQCPIHTCTPWCPRTWSWSPTRPPCRSRRSCHRTGGAGPASRSSCS